MSPILPLHPASSQPITSGPGNGEGQAATFEQFLLRLVEQEMLDRERRATERRIKAAKFPVSKSLDTYDFLAIPSLNKKLVAELARCEWIGRRENLLALGNSGTGKTHIGLALGLAACQQGFRVRFHYRSITGA
jgi:DNA replication protein DnaC